jgi:hypothetical protein
LSIFDLQLPIGTLAGRLKIGNWKLAIGNPNTFHLDFAATSTGIFAHAIQLTLGYI